jgi:hypothetical protein
MHPKSSADTSAAPPAADLAVQALPFGEQDWLRPEQSEDDPRYVITDLGRRALPGGFQRPFRSGLE